MRLIDADELKKQFVGYKYGTNAIFFWINKAPTVKALPIVWIDTYCTDCSIDLRDNDAKAIKKLLEDWREENENS